VSDVERHPDPGSRTFRSALPGRGAAGGGGLALESLDPGLQVIKPGGEGGGALQNIGLERIALLIPGPDLLLQGQECCGERLPFCPDSGRRAAEGGRTRRETCEKDKTDGSCGLQKNEGMDI